MEFCLFAPFRRPACCCLSLGLLTLLAGCDNTPHSAEHTEVSGKVLFQGKTLPGGIVSFTAVNGGFTSSGTIDENGNYQIKAPVGDMEISVMNRMLQSNRGSKGIRPPPLKKAEAKEQQP